MENFKPEEILFFYGDDIRRLKQKYYANKKIKEDVPYINKFFTNLSSAKKQNIKVIFGHRLYFGFQKHFPNRDVRYVTFIRDPTTRMTSHYNYERTLLDDKNTSVKVYDNLCRKLTKNGEVLDFKKWYSKNLSNLQNILFKILFVSFFGKKVNRKDIPVNYKNLNRIKSVLKKFYFIGVTENNSDYLYLYSLLDIKKFLPNQNVSKKYFVPDSYGKFKKFFIDGNKFDQEIYDYAKLLNDKFRNIHANYKIRVSESARVKTKYMRSLTFVIVLFKWNVLPIIYKISDKIKRRSNLYTKLIKIIKEENLINLVK